MFRNVCTCLRIRDTSEVSIIMFVPTSKHPPLRDLPSVELIKIYYKTLSPPRKLEIKSILAQRSFNVLSNTFGSVKNTHRGH